MALKLSIKQCQTTEEESKDKEIEFFLRETEGEIHLMASRKNFPGYGTWYVTTITRTGKLFIQADIPALLGLPTDKSGKIEITSTK